MQQPGDFSLLTLDEPGRTPHGLARHALFRVSDVYQAAAATHRVLLAYCSDYGLLGTSMLPHGLKFF